MATIASTFNFARVADRPLLGGPGPTIRGCPGRFHVRTRRLHHSRPNARPRPRLGAHAPRRGRVRCRGAASHHAHGLRPSLADWRSASGATCLAGVAQLFIPQLIGEAVDHAQGLLAQSGDDGSARAALAHAAFLIFCRVGPPRALHDDAELPGGGAGPAHRLPDAPRSLRQGAGPFVQLPRPGAHRRPDDPGDPRHRGHQAVGEHGGPAHDPARDPGRGRSVAAHVDRLGARVPRAQLRAPRRGRRLARPAAAPYPVARAAGGARGAHPGDGGEPGRHSRGARLRVPAFRDGPFRRHLRSRARAGAPAHRSLREEHHDDDLRVLRLDGPRAVGRRREGGGGRADDRRARLLPRLHGHPPDAGPPDRVDGELGGADLDLRRAPLRGARSRAGDPGPPGRARARSANGDGPLRERVLPLPQGGQGPAGAAGRELRGPPRAGHRHRGSAREREVDDRPPPAPLLRRRRREDHHRRPGRAGRDPRVAFAAT